MTFGLVAYCLYHYATTSPIFLTMVNIFTELLSISDKEKYMWAHRLMGVIYEVH
jgi:hypothetical protein